MAMPNFRRWSEKNCSWSDRRTISHPSELALQKLASETLVKQQLLVGGAVCVICKDHTVLIDAPLGELGV